MAIPKRTGIPAIRKVGHELCRLIVKFAPIILQISDNDPGVSTALAAALAACQALDEAIAEYQQQGV